MLKIRLMRLGDKKNAFYRVVVADGRSPRDGAFVDILGTYDPHAENDATKVDAEKVRDWIGKGAQPTDTARAVLVKAKIIEPTPYKAKANAKPATPKGKKKDAKKS